MFWKDSVNLQVDKLSSQKKKIQDQTSKYTPTNIEPCDDRQNSWKVVAARH